MNAKTIVNEISRRSTCNVNYNPDDYLVGDIVYCCLCRTQKQHKIIVLGDEMIVPCLCECAESRKKADETRIRQAKFDDHVASLRKEAFASGRMSEWTFAADDGRNQSFSTVARNYVDNFDVIRTCQLNGLLLIGNVGTGKTYLAACIANALIDQGISVIMTNMARIRNNVSMNYAQRQDYLDELNRCALLIIDDFGSEGATEYMDELVYYVINARVESGLPLIVTTNLMSNEIKNATDPKKRRIYSRILGSCNPVEVKGSDRRRTHLATEGIKMQELLGIRKEVND